MKCLLVFAALLGLSCAGLVKRQAGQQPKVFSALDELRGKSKLGNDDIRSLVLNSKAGEDYPNLAAVPDASFDCGAHKPGFYADVASRCQVVRRCDINGNLTSYLCPNMTVFNQITLVCVWFWDVDCSKSAQYYEYSNGRLYQENAVLLDDEPSYEEVAVAIQAAPSAPPKAAAKAPAKPAAKPAAKPKPAPAKGKNGR